MKRYFVLGVLALAATAGVSCGEPALAPSPTSAPELALAPSATPTLTPIPAATLTATPTPTQTPPPTNAPTPTPVPTQAIPPLRTQIPVPTPAPTYTPTTAPYTPTSTPIPSATPTSSPTAIPTPLGPAPTLTPAPTVTPKPANPPRPMGTLHQVTDEECSGSFGDQCKRAVVTCPGIADAAFNLRVTGAGNKGTILLISAGPRWYATRLEEEDIEANIMMDTLLDDGYKLVELAWLWPYPWEGARGSISLACRSATAFNWVHENFHQGGLFVAQGRSAGSADIAFSLAYYGMDEIFDLAHLAGGPPPCPTVIEGIYLREEAYKCLVGAESWDESKEPMLSGNPRLHYPNTIVRFFLGEDETASYIIETAHGYHDALTSETSLQIVPNTGHSVHRTREGTEALIASIREATGLHAQ